MPTIGPIPPTLQGAFYRACFPPALVEFKTYVGSWIIKEEEKRR